MEVNLRERLIREERRRMIESNVVMYQALAICAVTCAVSLVAVVVAMAGM